MNIVMTAPIDLRELTIFLERMNNKARSHIGFCGEDSEEIYDSLINDFSDLELKDSFLAAYHNDHIVGAIGLDVDSKKGCADVWGPFVAGEDMHIAQKLWGNITSKIPNNIKMFAFFLNEGNNFARDFVLKNKGIYKSSALILRVTRDKFIHHTPINFENYADSYREAFINLHDGAFPKTYFDANTIISRLNDVNQLFLVTEKENDIKGYVYIEANPTHGEADIEYVAVSEKRRKKGIGKILIVGAVNQLFSYPEIKEITICVAGDNIAAIHLYKSVGFIEKYTLVSYEISDVVRENSL